jgi:pimeloyl-ACP methyl ester carboxylesterase
LTTGDQHDRPATHEPWTHQEAVINGVRLHYVEQGSGPLVVLLHGFPEFWYSWRHQLPALASAGFRAVALDQRGYNTSEKPRGVSSYRTSSLVQDVAALVQHTGEQRATIAGHDWGGAVAWMTAALRPEVVERLVVINAPHPLAYRRAMRGLRQVLRSWYVLFFQLPWLPELMLRAGNYRAIDRVMRQQPRRPGTFSEEDIAAYKRAIAQPGALSAAVNYYRAAVRHPADMAAVHRIGAPTLLIWGEHDPYLGLELTVGLERWVPDIRVERLPNASHWAQVDAADDVSRLLIDFLQSH